MRETLASRDDIAGVILEPTGASFGSIPVTRDFVAALREATTEHGVLLLFDEVVTGFEFHLAERKPTMALRRI